MLTLSDLIELAPIPDGLEVVTIEERPELLEAAHPLALLGFADFALEAAATISLHDWREAIASHTQCRPIPELCCFFQVKGKLEPVRAKGAVPDFPPDTAPFLAGEARR